MNRFYSQDIADALKGQLRGNATDHTRMRAAEQALDRSGHGKITKMEVQTGYLIQEGIERIKQRARELGLVAVKKTEVVEVENESREEL